jgi:hypothetical protein
VVELLNGESSGVVNESFTATGTARSGLEEKPSHAKSAANFKQSRNIKSDSGGKVGKRINPSG